MHSLPAYLQNLHQTLLSRQSKKAAWDIIDEYFQCMKPEDSKKELWVLTKGAITNDLLEEADTGAKRQDLIFGYEFFCLFIDAIHLLHTKRQQKQLLSPAH